MDWCLKDKEENGKKITPLQTLGVKMLCDMPNAEQRKRFEIYAVPRIKAAKEGKENKEFRDKWLNMTFEKWVEDNKDRYFEGDVKERLPKELCNAPTGFFAPPLAFRGKIIAFSEILPEELRDEAYKDMTPQEMLDYADRLEGWAEGYEANNKELLQKYKENEDKIKAYYSDTEHSFLLDEEDKEKLKEEMLNKYGKALIDFIEELGQEKFYDYYYLRQAIAWLRFWGEKGHGLHAWY